MEKEVKVTSRASRLSIVDAGEAAQRKTLTGGMIGTESSSRILMEERGPPSAPREARSASDGAESRWGVSPQEASDPPWRWSVNADFSSAGEGLQPDLSPLVLLQRRLQQPDSTEILPKWLHFKECYIQLKNARNKNLSCFSQHAFYILYFLYCAAERKWYLFLISQPHCKNTKSYRVFWSTFETNILGLLE